MNQNLVIFYIFLIFLLFLFQSTNCREIKVEVNPNCDKYPKCKEEEKNNGLNLVHIWSEDTNNTIHYLWATITSIPPSLLIVKTDPKAKLTIDYTRLLDNNSDISNAITFSSEPINAIGLQFSRVFFFNDIDKSGSFKDNYPTKDFDWNDIIWDKVKEPKDYKNTIKFQFTSQLNKSITFDLRVDSSDGRDDDLPHLAFTDSSASLQFSSIDDNIEFNKTINNTKVGNNPRLMAYLLVIKDGLNSKSKPEFETITSIDDEYTPGVFNRKHLKLSSEEVSKSDSKVKNGFIQWKPIAYNANERIIANTLDVIESGVEDINQSEIIEYNSRLLQAFFENRTKTCHKFNLTFGATDDQKYYTKTKYNTFGLVVGLGSAPEDSLSLLVKMIILVGFGLPALVMVVSALYLIVRKIRKRNYNDLLLSQQSLDNNSRH